MKTRGSFSEIHYLIQGTPGLSEQGGAARETGNPIPPQSAEEALALIREEIGEEPPREPSRTADLATLRAALQRVSEVEEYASERRARFVRLAVVAALTGVANRSERWSGWTLSQVWQAWLETGLNEVAGIEGTWHLNKVLMRAIQLSRDPDDPPTLGRSNHRTHSYWVPRRPPIWTDRGWSWRNGTEPLPGGRDPGKAAADPGKGRAGKALPPKRASRGRRA